jgi:hypothetical protein
MVKFEGDATTLENVNVGVPTFLNVTLVFVLFVFTIWALKVMVLGVNDTGTPTPETSRVSEVFPCPSFGNVVLTVPFVVPLTVGEKVTLKEHDAPAATTVDAVTLQTGALRPVVFSLKPAVATGFVIVSELVPLFMNVTLVAGEVSFIVSAGKVMELGVNVS